MMDDSEYHKIQSVFLRDPAKNNKTFIEGRWSLPEFGYLQDCPWVWTEKVDGTNVRVLWNGEAVMFGGRTAEAQMPARLVERLQELFPVSMFKEKYPDIGMLLYGEGYGAKIQKGGGNYKADGVDFVLFDVVIAGLFLERQNVEDIAAKLGIRAVPVLGRGTLMRAIDSVRDGRLCSNWGTFQAEGLVMRPAVELQTRRGERIITKVKCKDFQP